MACFANNPRRSSLTQQDRADIFAWGRETGETSTLLSLPDSARIHSIGRDVMRANGVHSNASTEIIREFERGYRAGFAGKRNPRNPIFLPKSLFDSQQNGAHLLEGVAEWGIVTPQGRIVEGHRAKSTRTSHEALAFHLPGSPTMNGVIAAGGARWLISRDNRTLFVEGNQKWVDKLRRAYHPESVEKSAGRAVNPLFLPKNLFDSYIVRTTGGSVTTTVDKIQTLSGAEKAAKKLAVKYPCVGVEIVSAKHGSVIKSYKPAMGTAAPKVDRDNTRSYLKDQKKEAKSEVKYAVYVGGEHWSTEDTEAEAKAVGAEAGKSEGKRYTVKAVAGNPGYSNESPAYQSGARWAERMSSKGSMLANYHTAAKAYLRTHGARWTLAEKLQNEREFKRGALEAFSEYPTLGQTNPLTGSPSHDIPLLRREHYPQRQAVAIAMEEQRRRGNPKGPAYWYEDLERKAAPLRSYSDEELKDALTSSKADAKNRNLLPMRRSGGAAMIPVIEFEIKRRKATGRAGNPVMPEDFAGKERYQLQFIGPGDAFKTPAYYSSESAAKSAGRKWQAAHRGRSYKVYDLQEYKFVGMSRRNPEGDSSADAAALYREFHGVDSDGEFDIQETLEVDDTFAALGALVELWVIPVHGKGSKAVKITAPDPDRNDLHEVVTLASNPKGNQLFFVGGNQELDVKALGFKDSEVKPHMAIGDLVELTYLTRKKFHKLVPTQYYHRLGEESGICPILVYDPNNRQMSVVGGNYKVKPEGIVD